MSSSTPTTPRNDARSSSPTYNAPLISPSPQEALLVLTILERYQQVAQILKALREDRTAQAMGANLMSVQERENSRVAATGLFNQLYMLVQSRLLTPDGFSLVLAPRAAQLWLEYVAPLDAAVRLAAAAREGSEAPALGEHPIELFYRKYAESGGVLLRVPAAADPHTH